MLNATMKSSATKSLWLSVVMKPTEMHWRKKIARRNIWITVHAATSPAERLLPARMTSSTTLVSTTADWR